MLRHLLNRRLLAWGLLLLVPCLTQCTPSYMFAAQRQTKPRLGIRNFTTTDANSFGYRKWKPEKPLEAETVVIGIHGFDGAAIDFKNFAEYCQKEKKPIAVYSYEVRGQGSDPVAGRRGDIDDPRKWQSDQLTFTSLVRQKHPNARIIWYAESMGALISLHTLENWPKPAKPPCDGLIIASPVVAIRGDFPKWKKDLLRQVAQALPYARLSLNQLSGAEVQMTATTFHSSQAVTNSWHVETHTLRLLATLGTMIEHMSTAARRCPIPTLVVHGGKDYFCDSHEVSRFAKNLRRFPQNQRKFYPNGYHLLMYDAIRDEVFADVTTWIDTLPPVKPKESAPTPVMEKTPKTTTPEPAAKGTPSP